MAQLIEETYEVGSGAYGGVEDLAKDPKGAVEEAYESGLETLKTKLGIGGAEDTAAQEAAQAELDEQKAELEAEAKKKEEEIQKEIEKRNADRERVLSRGRGYGGTVLTQGLDSSTLSIKKKKLGVG